MDAVAGSVSGLSVTTVALAGVLLQFVVAAIAEVVPGGWLKKTVSVVLLAAVAGSACYVIAQSEKSAAAQASQLNAIQAGQGNEAAMAAYMANQRALMEAMTAEGAEQFGKQLETLPEKVKQRAAMTEAGNKLAGPLFVRWSPVQEWIVMNFDQRVAKLREQGLIEDNVRMGSGPLLVHDQPAGSDMLRDVILKTATPPMRLRLYQQPARFDNGQYANGVQISIQFFTPRTSDTLMAYELERDMTRVSANDVLTKRGFQSYETKELNPMQDVALRAKVVESIDAAVMYAAVEASSGEPVKDRLH